MISDWDAALANLESTHMQLEQLKAKRALLVVTLQRTDGAIALLDEMILEAQEREAKAAAVAAEKLLGQFVAPTGIDQGSTSYWRNRLEAERNVEEAPLITPDAPSIAPEMLPVTHDAELDLCDPAPCERRVS